MIKVVIVDRSPLVRQALCSTINVQKKVAVVAQTGLLSEITKICRQKNPNILLLSIESRDPNVLDVLNKIPGIDPEIRVLILVSTLNKEFAAKCLQHGATGLITKNISESELQTAILHVYSGHRYLSNDISRDFVAHKSPQFKNSPFDLLSAREMEITQRIIRGKDTLQIAKELCINAKTVNSYRYRAFQKLGIDNDVELTLLAIQYQIKNSDPESESEPEAVTE